MIKFNKYLKEKKVINNIIDLFNKINLTLKEKNISLIENNSIFNNEILLELLDDILESINNNLNKEQILKENIKLYIGNLNIYLTNEPNKEITFQNNYILTNEQNIEEKFSDIDNEKKVIKENTEKNNITLKG